MVWLKVWLEVFQAKVARATFFNDCHVIGTPTGIFVKRSIRRLPESFQFGELVTSPWEHGVAIGGDVKLGDRDALAVRHYARAHPYEDVDAAAISAEAGMQPSNAAPKPPSASPSVFGDDDEGGGTASSSKPDAAMPQPLTGSGDATRSSYKHDTEHDDVGAESKRLHFSGYQDVPHGNMVPQTPASVAEDVLDDTPFEQMASPAKAIKHDGPGSINLLGCIQNVEHLRHRT